MLKLLVVALVGTIAFWLWTGAFYGFAWAAPRAILWGLTMFACLTLINWAIGRRHR